ncbi:MAG: tyrosine-protein phosphatase, partial [Clostridia bacterium]|nr:tyrosine-protein phosphatase [Clostridia bacterium]
MTFNMLLAMTPAFAAGNSARAQALAYDRHSIGLTGVSNARELGGYRTKDGRTVKFGKLLR